MPQLDPRRQPIRLTPMVLVSATALTVGTLLWHVFQPLGGQVAPMDPGAAMALETQAYAEAATRPGFSQPLDVPIALKDGENLTDAVIRTGVAPGEAKAAIELLSSHYNVSSLKAGQTVEAAIARPIGNAAGQPAQLLGLTVRTDWAKQLTLTTSRDGEMRLRSLEEAVGRTDLLQQISRGGVHLDDLDLNPLLVKVEMDQHAIKTPATERNAVADTLDAQIVRDAAYVLERKEKMQLTYEVRNTMRAVGTRTSSELVRKYKDTLDEGHLTLELRGAAGQSLGAFAVKGLLINLIGEANDYVGKGLSGATIVIRPKAWHEGQALAGNTILYGATSGQLYIAGAVGERFAVRNSGATTVVEGVGAHGCEYMTGGKVVILGKVGQNFGAGMTGGVAYCYDPDKALEANVNGEGITLRAVPDDSIAELKGLITTHYERTLSPRAKAVLDDWDNSLKAFVQVMPNEILAIQQRQAKIA